MTFIGRPRYTYLTAVHFIDWIIIWIYLSIDKSICDYTFHTSMAPFLNRWCLPVTGAIATTAAATTAATAVLVVAAAQLLPDMI